MRNEAAIRARLELARPWLETALYLMQNESDIGLVGGNAVSYALGRQEIDILEWVLDGTETKVDGDG